MNKIAFTGGGSAGHVIPNVALMEELLSIGTHDVCYIGTDGIEKQIISKWKIPYYQIECPKLIRGFSWNALKNNVKIPIRFFRAVRQAKQGLRAFRPDVVFSKGGYVALPVVIAAKSLKIPCFAHESDFSMGLANKLSAPFCQAVFTSFPETAKRCKKGVYSGAPLRRSVLTYSKAQARRSLGIPFHTKTVLIFGGGSGSKAINAAVRTHLKALCENYAILHVCGKGNVVDSTVKNYYQFEFVADMGAMYAAADVVVSRAGSGTVFEILALKKPSILIPLEEQTRGDQAENAAYFEKQGLCKVLPQARLNELPKTIKNTLNDERLFERLRLSSLTSGNTAILQRLCENANQNNA